MNEIHQYAGAPQQAAYTTRRPAEREQTGAPGVGAPPIAIGLADLIREMDETISGLDSTASGLSSCLDALGAPTHSCPTTDDRKPESGPGAIGQLTDQVRRLMVIRSYFGQLTDRLNRAL